MKTIQTITVDDINNLKGQFIVQLNHNNNTKPITKENIDYYAFKRVAIVTIDYGDETYNMSGLFAPYSKPLTGDEFVEKFNAEGKNRYYRLMTPSEIALLMEYMIDQRKYI